jgi:hypothetical protein
LGWGPARKSELPMFPWNKPAGPALDSLSL